VLSWRDRILVVAEAGVNHNGDLQLAKQLIEVAHQAGADYVKFQTFTARYCISKNAAKAEYQTRVTPASESQLEMVTKLELTEADHQHLIEHARGLGIGFMSTAFDLPAVDLLQKFDLDFFKVASGEVTNLPLLRKIAATGKPIVLSTGMCRLGEIERALEVLLLGGVAREQILLLQCNTEYPTPMEHVNLNAMLTMGKVFALPVGYSDHTEGTCISVAATALGARLIEKHITLDRRLPGPDQQASIEGPEFRRMVQEIRQVEQALGNGLKLPSPSESKNLAIARRSIVASGTIEPGEIFTEQNLICKRPGTGMSPMLWDHLLGRRATRRYQEDEMIKEGTYDFGFDA